MPVGGVPPARSPHASFARSGRSRSPARPGRRPPAPRPGPRCPPHRRCGALPARRPCRELCSEWSISKPGQALPPRGLFCWAGPLCVPVGGGPPARSPHVSFAQSGRSRSPARPCRRPPAPRPGPAGLAAASNRSGCLCDARPGPSGLAAPPIGRACRLCVDRLSRRPPAPRSGPPAPPAPSTPAGPGVLVCCSSFRNLACNSPPALCWFVSVYDVTPLVFVNCMRLLLSAGPSVAHRHRGWAVLTFPVLQADQTGCVRG